MTTKEYYKYQLKSVVGEDFDRLTLTPRIPALNDLPDPLLATILSHGLSNRRDGFLDSIMNTARMNKKTTSARPAPNFLLVNKKFHRVGMQVWLKTDFCHIYVNSWTPLHRGLISCASDLPFVVMTLDIRRGERSLGEKLVPSAFGAKLRELFQEMKQLEVLLVRVWHGIGSLGPVSEIIMNNFAGVRVGQAVNIASIVSTAHGIDEDRGCPGLLSESYMENFVSHLLPLETADSVWLPAIKEPGELGKDKQTVEVNETEGDGRDAEEDEAMAQMFQKHMMDIPWVKAAAKAAKEQEKVRQTKEKRKKKVGTPAGEKDEEGVRKY